MGVAIARETTMTSTAHQATIAWRNRGSLLGFRGHDVFHLRERAAESVGNILCVHGFPTSSWDWLKVWPVLAERHDVVAADMLGYGFSAKPRGPLQHRRAGRPARGRARASRHRALSPALPRLRRHGRAGAARASSRRQAAGLAVDRLLERRALPGDASSATHTACAREPGRLARRTFYQ